MCKIKKRVSVLTPKLLAYVANARISGHHKKPEEDGNAEKCWCPQSYEDSKSFSMGFIFRGYTAFHVPNRN